MGNRSSTEERRRSDGPNAESTKIRTKSRDFGKSQSMMELGKKKNGSAKATSSSGATSVRRNGESVRNGSSSGVSRQKSMIRRDISHPLSAQHREIIAQCFENPHSEFGNKVLQRIFEKRSDYQKFIYALGRDKWPALTARLKDLVEEVISRIDDVDYIAKISRVYGEEHVDLKGAGFKPDFWVGIADAITVEGVILDMANHQPADTVAAWSQLVSLMFSSVRDGYYQKLRAQRMSSRRGIQRQATVESSVENENGHEKLAGKSSVPTPRSISLYAVGGSSVHSENMNLPKPIFE